MLRQIGWAILLTFTLCALLACDEATAAPGELRAINAVAGDRSWEEMRGGDPAGADEKLRIQTHLRWVEARLRGADVTGLSAQQRRRREALLDELRDYRQAGVFPRHSPSTSARFAAGTRSPRFVDDEGRHCAVAHLIATSGRPDLVAAIQRDHELDLVGDMVVAGLEPWATAHGFSRHELALIQPSYPDGGGVDLPSEIEWEWAEKKRREEAKKPRPLTSEFLRDIVTRFAHRSVVQTCVGERTGRWKMEAELRAGRDLEPRAKVRVRAVENGSREKELEECFERALLKGARVSIGHVNHTFERKLHETHSQTFHAATPAEIEAEFFARDRAWHSVGTRESATRTCVEGMPATALPLRVPLRVGGWRGGVTIRWDDVPEEGRSAKNGSPKKWWYCLREILHYGDLSVYGVKDHEFDIEVLPDGTLRPAP